MNQAAIQSAIINEFRLGFNPPFSGSIDKWSEKNVVLSSGYSVTGNFDCSISPHFRKIFAAIQNPYIREISICAPPRSGKTLIAELSLLHTIAHSSGDILWLQLSDDKAKEMVKSRMIPLIKSCPAVSSLLSDDKYNLQNNEFKFLHSMVRLASPNGDTLNSTGYKTIFADECYAYKGNSIIKFIKKRADEYQGVSKCIFFSRGGMKYGSWHEQYCEGEQWEYGFKCPKCNELQSFEITKKRNDGTYAGLVWSDKLRDKLGNWIIKDCAADAKLECYHCKYQITDEVQNRTWLMDNGDWIKTGGDSDKIKSFRFTNLCNIKMSFGELVTRLLSAKNKLSNFGSTEDLELFVQEDCADFWDASTQKTRTEITLAEYNTDNPFGLQEEFRFLTIDCQNTEPFFYYICRAWTKTGESRLVSFGKCNTWQEVNAIRERNKVDYRFVFVDTGDGQRTESHYSECVRNGRIANIGGNYIWTSYNSLKGHANRGFKHADNKIRRFNEPQQYYVSNTDPEHAGKAVTHVTWSNLRYKTILETLRDGKGKKWEASDVTEEYTTHLNSEFLQRKVKGNMTDFEYVQKPNTPNHWWDCENMQLVAADLFGCLDTMES